MMFTIYTDHLIIYYFILYLLIQLYWIMDRTSRCSPESSTFFVTWIKSVKYYNKAKLSFPRPSWMIKNRICQHLIILNI